ncbi:phosphopantothenate--cysteine ligase 2 isoform X1 [Brassica napus]|uniref:phosphopantothenate--cysteine ligase 2 isoform X1 n=1 Tax=Brassica napus TaxID=3708 RepID=UPI002078EC19|nr:phosphopantothenate--cysteine ligase 2 isoform X1 [Brassica napus]XP_048602631.1 phosphopantothenate--cysteine ligase 2 isoform X1 [Brassica napus]
MSCISELGEDEVNSFFESSPPLKNMEEIVQKLNAFIHLNSSAGGRRRRIVCVTSGGTTVPLEQRCVRYIDNFSSGNRGAASTENFVKAGYAVIFLFRRGTCQPYSRSLPDDPFLECFQFPDNTNIQVNASHVEAVKMAVMDQQAVRIVYTTCVFFLLPKKMMITIVCVFLTLQAVAESRLLKLSFTTIYEYLQMLQLIATALKDVGPCSMFYLAAAVSDFYVPWKSMTEHKIESGSGPLDIRLAQVPKMLSILRANWAPKAFCISFKLETDSKILIEKATKALRKYKVHAVVANELSTRKEEVVVVSSSGNVVVRCDSEKPGSIVEDNLIRLIVDRHSTYIKEFST